MQQTNLWKKWREEAGKVRDNRYVQAACRVLSRLKDSVTRKLYVEDSQLTSTDLIDSSRGKLKELTRIHRVTEKLKQTLSGLLNEKLAVTIVELGKSQLKGSKFFHWIRDLLFNLKRNDELVQRIKSASLPVSKLLVMSVEDMAPKKMAKKRERLKRAAVGVVLKKDNPAYLKRPPLKADEAPDVTNIIVENDRVEEEEKQKKNMVVKDVNSRKIDPVKMDETKNVVCGSVSPVLLQMSPEPLSQSLSRKSSGKSLNSSGSGFKNASPQPKLEKRKLCSPPGKYSVNRKGKKRKPLVEAGFKVNEVSGKKRRLFKSEEADSASPSPSAKLLESMRELDSMLPLPIMKSNLDNKASCTERKSVTFNIPQPVRRKKVRTKRRRTPPPKLVDPLPPGDLNSASLNIKLKKVRMSNDAKVALLAALNEPPAKRAKWVNGKSSTRAKKDSEAETAGSGTVAKKKKRFWRGIMGRADKMNDVPFEAAMTGLSSPLLSNEIKRDYFRKYILPTNDLSPSGRLPTDRLQDHVEVVLKTRKRVCVVVDIKTKFDCKGKKQLAKNLRKNQRAAIYKLNQGLRKEFQVDLYVLPSKEPLLTKQWVKKYLRCKRPGGLWGIMMFSKEGYQLACTGSVKEKKSRKPSKIQPSAAGAALFIHNQPLPKPPLQDVGKPVSILKNTKSVKLKKYDQGDGIMNALLALDGVTGGSLSSKTKKLKVKAANRKRPPPPPKTAPQSFNKKVRRVSSPDSEAKALHNLLSALKQSDEVIPQQPVINPRDPRITTSSVTEDSSINVRKPPLASPTTMLKDPMIHEVNPTTKQTRSISVPNPPPPPRSNPRIEKGAPPTARRLKSKSSSGWRTTHVPRLKRVEETRGSYPRPPGPPPRRSPVPAPSKQNGWISNYVILPELDRRKLHSRVDRRSMTLSKDPYSYNSSHAMLKRRHSRSPSPLRNRFAMESRRGRSLGGVRCVNRGRGRSSRLRNSSGNYGRERVTL